MDKYTIKLATEKNLNRYLSPVISLKGKSIKKYPIANKGIDTLSVCDHGTIGAGELMLMDILGTCITHAMNNCSYRKGVNFSQRIPKNSDNDVQKISGSRIPPEMLSQVIKGIENCENGIIPERFYDDKKATLMINSCSYTMDPPIEFVLTDSLLFKQLPFLKKKIKTSKRLLELFTKTANCKLRMNFPITLFEEGEYKKHQYGNINSPSNLFSLEVKNDKVSLNGNILSRKYRIKFDTLLGYFFIQNILSCSTNLLPGHFYNMSEYAQLFYRMLILLYYNGVKIPISLKEIKARLVLKSDNSMSRKVVKRILEELELNRFISNPKEIIKEGTYWYRYHKNDWKTITGVI